MITPRSYLFVPGHREKMVAKAFSAGADAVILDLEDAVPAADKAAARETVRAALAIHQAWVRINQVRTQAAEADLAAVGGRALGIRIPKTESPDDVAWVLERVSRELPVLCAIETASGILAAPAIAAAPAVARLAMGGLDMRRDLGCGNSPDALAYARGALVVASRAAGLPGPVDTVYADVTNDDGLLADAAAARELGFAAKSAIHPRQVPLIHRALAPSEQDRRWAREVVAAVEASGGRPTTLRSGEFVDEPARARAAHILSAAGLP